jgi:hypothetical protein
VFSLFFRLEFANVCLGSSNSGLADLDGAVTLLAPLLGDGPLGRRPARRGRAEDPAWRDATLARWHPMRALALRARRHALGIGLGQDGLGCGQGCWNAGDPREAGRGPLVPIRGARESTVGHERGGGGSGVELRHGVTEDLAERCAILTMATPGLPQPRDTGLRLHHSCQPHLGEGRAMSPTSALGEVHDRCVRRRRAVIAAIDMQTRRVGRAARAPQPQPRGRCGGNEAVECRHPQGVEGIEAAPEGVILAMAGLHAWGNETCERLMLETMRAAGALVGEKAQTVAHHGLDRMASGHKPRFRVLRGGSSNDCRDPEFCKHARDQPQGISDRCAVRLRLEREGRAIRVSHNLLLGRGMVAAPKNYAMTRAWCGIAGKDKVG